MLQASKPSLTIKIKNAALGLEKAAFLFLASRLCTSRVWINRLYKPAKQMTLPAPTVESPSPVPITVM